MSPNLAEPLADGFALGVPTAVDPGDIEVPEAAR
jgi:hypothetical protein